MALPYPDKPEITDKINTIVSNIRDNLAYVDTYNRLKMITFNKDVSVTGDVAYTGVGFSSRLIIFLAEEPVSTAMSWGVYSESYSRKSRNSCINSHGDVFTGDYAITIYMLGGVPHSNEATAKVKSIDADGFTLTWEHSTGSPTGTATIIAFCIR